MYRITVSATLAMSPDPQIKASVRVTVTATAVIINLVVILILDEIYGSVAAWLTELGKIHFTHLTPGTSAIVSQCEDAPLEYFAGSLSTIY